MRMGRSSRSGEEARRETGDDDVLPQLKALRKERDSRRDSVASGETDLILDEADRELHSRAGCSSVESDDVVDSSTSPLLAYKCMLPQ